MAIRHADESGKGASSPLHWNRHVRGWDLFVRRLAGLSARARFRGVELVCSGCLQPGSPLRELAIQAS